jgi:hypothetical protein
MRSRDGKETPGEKAMKSLRDGNFSSITSKGRGAGAEEGGNEGNEDNEGSVSSSEDVRRRLGLGIKKSTAAQPARFESSDDEPAVDGVDKDKKKRRWWKRKSSLPKATKQDKEEKDKDKEIRKSAPPALMGMGFKGKDGNGSRPGTGTTAVDSMRPATAATAATDSSKATVTDPVKLAADGVPPVPLVPLVRSITNPSGATTETPTAGIVAAIDGTHELKKVDSNTSSKRRARKLSRRDSVDPTGGLPREKKGRKVDGEKDGKKKGWKRFFGKS